MKQKQFLLAFLAMLLCFAAPSFAQNVAKIGNAEPTTLAEAIKNASAGQTITLVGDVTENVTISKSLTIDGANFKYTGSTNEVDFVRFRKVNGTYVGTKYFHHYIGKDYGATLEEIAEQISLEESKV